MSSLKLKHSGGNSMSIEAPATNPTSNLALKLPATIGSANQILKNSGTAGTLGWSALVEDSSGNIGIGTTSPTAKFDVRRDDTDGKIAEFHQSAGYGIDIGSSQSVGYIASGYGQDFVFKTDPSSGQTERMRLTSGGKFYVGTTNGAFGNDASQHSAIVNSTANEYTLSLRNTVDSSDGRTLLCACGKSTGGRLIFFERADGTTVGSITHNGSATAFNTSSDYRLKENVTAISDGITRLKTLKPSRFNFKDSKDTTVDGFVAHEVTAVPEAITGTKDAVDSDNKPIYQGIDQSKLVPLLTAALQEEVAKREALEARVAALEAA